MGRGSSGSSGASASGLGGRGRASLATVPLPDFASRVEEAARGLAGEGLHGRGLGEKVLVSELHRATAPGMTLEAFKARLLEAQRAGHIELTRADLVAGGDIPESFTAAVASSEIEYLGARFNYVLPRPGRR